MTADVRPDAAIRSAGEYAPRLRDDAVIRIVTVGADGRPQPNPVGCRWLSPSRAPAPGALWAASSRLAARGGRRAPGHELDG